MLMLRSSEDEQRRGRRPAGGMRGQIPTVTVIVPGRSEVARTVTASRRARRAPRPAGRRCRRGRARDRASWSMPAAGSAPGQVLATIDRSVQAQQAAQLAAQVQVARADAALAQNELRAQRSRWSGAASCPRPISTASAPRATPPMPASASPRPSSARPAPRSGGSTFVAPTSGPGPAAQRRGRPGRQRRRRARCSASPRGGEMEMRAPVAAAGPVALIRVGMPASVTPIGARPQLCRHGVAGVAGDRPAVAPGRSADRRPLRSARSAPAASPRRKISSGSTTAPLLPQSAVLSDEKGNYVYVINGQERGRAARHQDRRGRRCRRDHRRGLERPGSRRAVGRAVPQSRAEGLAEPPGRALTAEQKS